MIERGRPTDGEARRKASQRACHAIGRRHFVPLQEVAAMETPARTKAQADDGREGESGQKTVVAVIREIVGVEHLRQRIVIGDAMQTLAHLIGLPGVIDVGSAGGLKREATIMARQDVEPQRQMPINLPLLEVIAHARRKLKTALAREVGMEVQACLQSHSTRARPLDHRGREHGGEFEAR